MTLALFDLDNTLLSGDSDHEWGNFLISKNLVDGASYKAANDAFYAQYKQGSLDIFEYSAFSFFPLTQHSMSFLNVLHEEFMDTVILPLIRQKAIDLVESHRAQGHTLIVITATNSFITKPIVKYFGIDNLLATEVKMVEGKFTNSIEGTPCFSSGKVTRIRQWLDENNESLNGSLFYSDSHNDLPLMELVDTAIAVDPDEKLAIIAKERGWDTISLL
ncbi:HAD-superfamily subfamily IB hydrolase, TIGR01490 [Desulfocapsa sulfexigens DSM 10523]|uniref:HAD-superfamily subfamily IB hydrolase, TIGR01490 n=1 Tax=Desulfocapsa sulfexigens (strain DSM 10523 / SB164P1) TaxID=1167006 RepID=M1PCS9_DESSD|nr:HAD family hydrolase [Desulfocapsa sulfexigens]AGF79412.1 HAD-superfamily subfamily IB hydrolase, TIGR01490 [Desulfocapsa sulfexigens DSM 10523]